MMDILIINDNSDAKNFLIKSLESAGFTVIDTENGLVRVHLPEKKLPHTEESEKLSNIHSIFPSIPRLNEVFKFIELNYHQSISLKEVAQAVGYSSGYLTELVRRLTGKTVNDWIILRRLTEACTLLLETNDSVNQIASKVGYQNINHFYCQFRDYHSITPHAWREAQRCQLGQNKKLPPHC
ncbi:helix-turn-helix domain-containing protein [Scytonema sp. UIC 10036]|uniref:response regulator transcription factor n=1 Tax=Scytonema sp. UIC 10036 TaxID=2304196 RepID=UPI0012DAA407|nr:DNA-binding response regulator [Scytonema sp. UIC 10036]MUG92915.1 helix-turn-helix domain-containing protein [Scytonema sp. UIC 10036]